MTRAEIETALQAVYAARAANDAPATAAIFAPDAVYRVPGNEATCAAVTTYSGDVIGSAMERLCRLFRAERFAVESMMIDGDRACVVVDAILEFTPTGEVVTTKVGHFWTFENGKVVELIEFLDTAHVAHLVGHMPLNQVA